MSITGHCHCGAISFVAEGKPLYHALCHCADCRSWSGTPVSSWMAFKTDQLTITGQPVRYRSSENATREFCGSCGTGLFYRNQNLLPDMVDIQSGTIDNLALHPATTQIMTKDKLPWMDKLETLPRFQKYPGME